MTAPASRRYHSLDALRASMMLLGIVLHSAVNYTVTPLGAAWPFKDARTNVVFDLLVFVIHLFRMPVFFVAAGFFAALLMRRDGPRAFIGNRAKRVLLPLALFWPIVIPASMAGFLYANARAGTPLDVATLDAGPLLKRPLLGHLWFLWDLMIYGILGAFVRLLERPSPIVRYLSDASYWMYLLHLPFAIALAGVLAPFPMPALVKFTITAAVTAALTLVSYRYLVRATAVGALLNGRRHPRGLTAR